MIKTEDKRRKTIVKHERLSKPTGKETPYKYDSKTISYIKNSWNNLGNSHYIYRSNRNKSYDTYSHRSYKKTHNKSTPSFGKYSTLRKSSNEKSKKFKKNSYTNVNENTNTNEENTYNLEQNMNSGYNNEEGYLLNENVNNYNQNNQSQNYYEQNSYNERYLEKGQYLPYYSDEFKYKSQTENLKICRKCGKPRKPKKGDSSNTTDYAKQTISRGIYENQLPQYEYTNYYYLDNNINQPEVLYEGQNVDNQVQYEDDYSSYNTNYRPIHYYH